MYRQYENPHGLEERLAKLQEKFAALPSPDEDGFDMDECVDLHEEIEELKERINFAYADAEYDELFSSI